MYGVVIDCFMYYSYINACMKTNELQRTVEWVMYPDEVITFDNK